MLHKDINFCCFLKKLNVYVSHKNQHLENAFSMLLINSSPRLQFLKLSGGFH